MRVLVQGSVFVFWVEISQRGALEQFFFLSPRESCLLFLLLKVSCSWTVCLLVRVLGWYDWDLFVRISLRDRRGSNDCEGEGQVSFGLTNSIKFGKYARIILQLHINECTFTKGFISHL